jgi:hypothetical protein
MIEFVLKANDMNVKAKRTRYHFAICKWIHGLATAFIAQQGILNYNKDVAVMDLLASSQDKILASLAIPLQNFLAAYKVANNLLGGIPTPAVTCNFIDKINHINDTPRLETAENAAAAKITSFRDARQSLGLCMKRFGRDLPGSISTRSHHPGPRQERPVNSIPAGSMTVVATHRRRRRAAALLSAESRRNWFILSMGLPETMQIPLAM